MYAALGEDIAGRVDVASDLEGLLNVMESYWSPVIVGGDQVEGFVWGFCYSV